VETIIVSMETTELDPSTGSAFEGHLGYWLRRVSNAVSSSFARALQEKRTSVAEWVVLRELYKRGKTSPGELADSLGLTRGAVSKIVDKLGAKGWVHMEAKESDSRFRVLSLTRAGRRSLPVLAEIADENDARYFDCLTAGEKNTLRELLIKLADHNHIHDVPTE
jgi:DNA-binding MarR family transcriptional regulator